MADDKKEVEEFFESKKTYFKLGLVLAFVILMVVVYRKLKNENKI